MTNEFGNKYGHNLEDFLRNVAEISERAKKYKSMYSVFEDLIKADPENKQVKGNVDMTSSPVNHNLTIKDLVIVVARDRDTLLTQTAGVSEESKEVDGLIIAAYVELGNNNTEQVYASFIPEPSSVNRWAAEMAMKDEILRSIYANIRDNEEFQKSFKNFGLLEVGIRDDE